MSVSWRSVLVACAVVAQAAMAGTATPTVAVPQRGEQIYQRCIACHAIDRNRTGPQHCGLFGRRAGTAPGFADYSQALRASGTIWNERTLDVFLQAPTKAVPGTSMGYDGLKIPQERADLIAWLRQAAKPGKACTVSR